MNKNQFLKSSVLMTMAELCADFLVIWLSLVGLGLVLKIDISNQIYGDPVSFTVLFLLLFFLISMQFNLYAVKNRKIYDVLFTTLLSSILTSCAIMVSGYVLFRSPVNARGLFVVLGTTSVCMTVWRCILEKIIRKVRGREKLLVIECKGVADTLVRKVKYSCLDWFDAWYTSVNIEDKNEMELFLSCEFKQYSSIFITQSLTDTAKKRIIEEALKDQKTIYLLPATYDIQTSHKDMVQFSDMPAFCIQPFVLGIGQRFFKRLFDILVSACALVIFSPFMLIIAAAIKLDSRGSVIYSQTRLTQDKQEFCIYKFRTMNSNAEEKTGPVLSGVADTRITRVGRFLRATRLDEIPQLVNILKGEMSLIGPRPERPKFVEEFSQEIENYDQRFKVKAGLTGYAQVYANYDTTPQDKLLYDLLYIREYTPMLDLKISLLTIKAVFDRRASRGVQQSTWTSRQL